MGYVVLPEFRQRSTQAYNQYFHAYHLFTSLHCLTGSSKINHTFISRNQSIINRAIRSEKQEKIWPLARELSFHNSCYYQFLSKSERPPPTIPDPNPSINKATPIPTTPAWKWWRRAVQVEATPTSISEESASKLTSDSSSSRVSRQYSRGSYDDKICGSQRTRDSPRFRC